LTKFETDVSEATPQSSGDFENERPEVIPERDLSVLRLIGDEELTGFTFDGLKRRLGAHSETLSRTLDRLESEGIVEKGEQG
jgi:DNA-binding MarR family transcriptional regulator